MAAQKWNEEWRSQGDAGFRRLAGLGRALRVCRVFSRCFRPRHTCGAGDDALKNPANLALLLPSPAHCGVGGARCGGGGKKKKSIERQRLSLISFMPAHLQRYELRRFQRAALWQRGRLSGRPVCSKMRREGGV